MGVYVWGTSIEWIAAKVGIIAGLVTGLGIIWKKLVEPCLDATGGHINKIKRLISEIEKITHEFRPNGGSSIRDAINRIEARLISLERVQGALRQDGPLGIFQCTTDGKNVDVNRTYCRWLGVSKQDLMGWGWRSYLADASAREDYDNEWKQAFEEGRECEFTIAFKTSDGEIVHYLVHTYPLADQNNKVTQFLGILYPTDEGTYIEEQEFI